MVGAVPIWVPVTYQNKDGAHALFRVMLCVIKHPKKSSHASNFLSYQRKGVGDLLGAGVGDFVGAAVVGEDVGIGVVGEANCC